MMNRGRLLCTETEDCLRIPSNYLMNNRGILLCTETEDCQRIPSDYLVKLLNTDLSGFNSQVRFSGHLSGLEGERRIHYKSGIQEEAQRRASSSPA